MRYDRLWKRGSTTVEMAMLMPLILVVFFGVLTLFFWVHNRSWLTSAACEASVSGSMEGTDHPERALKVAENKARELGSIGFFGTENLNVQVTSGNKTRVGYQLEILSVYGGWTWNLNVSEETRRVQQVRWIRKVKSASEAVKEKGS